jgi:hypothetical protein
MALKQDFIDTIMQHIIELRDKGNKVKMKNQEQFSQTITDTYVSLFLN